MRFVGDGRLVYLSDAIVMGGDWHHNKRLNVGLLGRLVDWIALSGQQIDPEKPFEETPIQSVKPLRVKGCDTPIYASARYADGAARLKDELSAIVPHIRKELGRAYQPLEGDICFVARGAGRARRSLSRSRRKDRDGYDVSLYQVDVLSASPLESLLMEDEWHHGRLLALFYDTVDCDYRWTLQLNWRCPSFIRAMLNYQMFRIIKAAKMDDLATRYRAACSQENEIVENESRSRARYFAAYDELYESDPELFTRFLGRIAQRYHNDDFCGALDINQFAKILSGIVYGAKPGKFAGTPHKAEQYVEKVFNPTFHIRPFSELFSLRNCA